MNKKQKNRKQIKQNYRNKKYNLKYKIIIKILFKILKSKEQIINSTVISNKLKNFSLLLKYLDKSLKKNVFHKNNINRKKKLANKIYNEFFKKTQNKVSSF